MSSEVKTPIERYWVWVALAILAIGLISEHPWRVDQIHWHQNLKEAKLLANRENKPILIDFSSESCVPCRQMDGDAFADRQIESVIDRRFIPVRLDGFNDVSDLKAFHVSGIPTVLILNSKGMEIGRTEGYVSSRDFLSFLGS